MTPQQLHAHEMALIKVEGTTWALQSPSCHLFPSKSLKYGGPDALGRKKEEQGRKHGED